MRAVPNSADDGIGAAVLLCTFLLDGTDPLEFEHTGTMVRKPTGDTWSGDAVATGTARFFRVVQSGDTNGTSASDVRAQPREELLARVGVVQTRDVCHVLDQAFCFGREYLQTSAYGGTVYGPSRIVD